MFLSLLFVPNYKLVTRVHCAYIFTIFIYMCFSVSSYQPMKTMQILHIIAFSVLSVNLLIRLLYKCQWTHYYIFMFVCIQHVCIRMCMRMYICVHMRACLYMFICVCMWLCILIHLWLCHECCTYLLIIYTTLLHI